MSAIYAIPLNPTPERFGITLPDGTALRITLAWRNFGGGGWVLDLATADDVPLVSGLPLVTGIDLLSQHRHLGIPGALMVASDNPPNDDVPTYDGLGVSSQLYYVTV